MPVFEPIRGEPDVVLENKGRVDEGPGVNLLAELINKGQRRVYSDFN